MGGAKNQDLGCFCPTWQQQLGLEAFLPGWLLASACTHLLTSSSSTSPSVPVSSGLPEPLCRGSIFSQQDRLGVVTLLRGSWSPGGGQESWGAVPGPDAAPLCHILSLRAVVGPDPIPGTGKREPTPCGNEERRGRVRQGHLAGKQMGWARWSQSSLENNNLLPRQGLLRSFTVILLSPRPPIERIVRGKAQAYPLKTKMGV